MGVVSHDCDWLGERRDGGGGWYACGVEVVGCMFGDAGAIHEHKVMQCWLLITPPSRCIALVGVKPELVSLLRKALSRDATGRLWFDVHATGWLHYMVHHGHKLLITHDAWGWAATLAFGRLLKSLKELPNCQLCHSNVISVLRIRICSTDSSSSLQSWCRSFTLCCLRGSHGRSAGWSPNRKKTRMLRPFLTAAIPPADWLYADG